jgi:hypothetical protein
MNRGQSKNPDLKQPPTPPVSPAAKVRWGVSVALSFLVNFLLYVMTLAPTVTFEDSGEFISAAYNLGIPHEPGYPLFTMLGKLFTLLPLGNIAYRVNLLSAFFTALAGVFVFLITVMLIENILKKPIQWKKCPAAWADMMKYSAGLCACILFGTASSSWEQAVITEVYGLNSFLTGLFVYLIAQLKKQNEDRENRRRFYGICFVMGLALTNHTTSAMFIPLFGFYLLLTDRKVFRNFALLAKSSGFFAIGLLPLSYLLIAAGRNPVINWGDPENLTNFMRVITRHQYGQTKQTLETFSSQFGVFASELLTKQWFPAVLIFAIPGLVILFKKNKPFFMFSLAFLLFAMPIMTWMTNFDVTSPAVAFEHKALVSVFYIPAYLFLSILMGTGIYYMLSFNSMNSFAIRAAALVLPLVAFAAAGVRNFKQVTLHDYYCAQEYSNNIFKTLPGQSLLFVHWDPFSFPLMYYQCVEHKRQDLLVLDQMLLKRTWYLTWLRRHHATFAKRFEKEIKAFLAAVAPFENGKPYNGETIQRCYIGMINAFIDGTLADNRSVYCTYTPEPSIVRGYRLEPVLSAFKFSTSLNIDTTVSFTACDLSTFSDERFPGDRMKKYFREYYGNQYGLRGMLFEENGKRDEARTSFLSARRMFANGSQQALFIDTELKKLRP